MKILTDKDNDGLFSLYSYLLKHEKVRSEFSKDKVLFEGDKMNIENESNLYIFDLDLKRVKRELNVDIESILRNPSQRVVVIDHHRGTKELKEKYDKKELNNIIVYKSSPSTLSLIDKEHSYYGSLADNPFKFRDKYNLDQIIFMLSVSNSISTADNKLLKDLISSSLENNYSLPQFFNAVVYSLKDKVDDYRRFFKEVVDKARTMKEPFLYLGEEDERNKFKNATHLVYAVSENRFPYIFTMTKIEDGYIVRVRTNKEHAPKLWEKLEKKGFKVRGRETAFGFFSEYNPEKDIKEILKGFY